MTSRPIDFQLTVVVPCYNEEDVLEATTEALTREVPPILKLFLSMTAARIAPWRLLNPWRGKTTG